ncbi:MAG: GMC family oxidoreductase [Desulfobacteraceae bacterium]|nr:GMC family oxidoreductase [Desulfobacteraceae bacterium]
MSDKKYDYVIVGSGAGGATLAKELSAKGKSVAVLEKGVREEKLGTFLDCCRYFDLNMMKMPPKSKEGVVLWRSFMAGGPTVVCCGNGVRCLEDELSELGINLEEEFKEAEEEMGITPYDIRRLSSGSKKILEACSDLGYSMEPMPKFIDPKKCRRCGKCQYGCKYGAKWTAVEYLDEAENNGADIFYNNEVDKVIIENGSAKGVVLKGKKEKSTINAEAIILSAGGFGTPIIMQRSGLDKAGSKLFIDMFVNTYGIAKGLDQTKEPTMALVDHEFHKSEGFILSPFIHQFRMIRFIELGMKGMLMPTEGMLGIMTKTADDSAGRIYPDGSFSKPITEEDKKRLEKGSSISKEILIKAGADSKSIIVSKVAGAHPGGTAAIGEIVDSNLQTEVNNLFVCDGSVLPTAAGAPPILTIAALAKRLAKSLT